MALVSSNRARSLEQRDNVSQEIVLVVEDDVLIRMPIAQYLRDCGYRVIEAACADEAMAVLLHEEKMLM